MLACCEKLGIMLDLSVNLSQLLIDDLQLVVDTLLEVLKVLNLVLSCFLFFYMWRVFGNFSNSKSHQLLKLYFLLDLFLDHLYSFVFAKRSVDISKWLNYS